MTKLSNKPKTKKAQLIRLLGTKSGRSADVLCQKLNWQPHTVRAAVSGLRKAGYGVACEKQANGDAKYRITSEPGIEAALAPEAA